MIYNKEVAWCFTLKFTTQKNDTIIYESKHEKKEEGTVLTFPLSLSLSLSSLSIKVELNPRHAISSKTSGIKIPHPAIIIT